MHAPQARLRANSKYTDLVHYFFFYILALFTVSSDKCCGRCGVLPSCLRPRRQRTIALGTMLMKWFVLSNSASRPFPPNHQSSYCHTLVITLVKGQCASLKGLSNITVGLGWDPSEQYKAFDLDACVFMFNGSRKLPTPKHHVFYNNAVSPPLPSRLAPNTTT